MTDNGHLLSIRDRLGDAYHANMWLDGGIEAARTLRITALLGIATRLFYIWASAHRISFTHTVLGMLDENGRINLNGRTDGGAGLVSQGHDADAMVTIAVWASFIVFILFFLATLSLIRRKKRGDPLAAAIRKNRAVLLAGWFYLLVSIANVIARKAFNPSSDASPVDRLHTVLYGDTATIGFQIAVIAFLLIITLATGREIGKARAAGRIG